MFGGEFRAIKTGSKFVGSGVWLSCIREPQKGKLLRLRSYSFINMQNDAFLFLNNFSRWKIFWENAKMGGEVEKDDENKRRKFC